MTAPLVELSVNQLVSETRKACLGKGVSFGIADDIAKAVQLLANHNVVPEKELVAYLQAPLETAPQTPHIQGHNMSLSGTVTITDMLSALDFMVAYRAKNIVISGLCYPCLSLGLFALAQNPHVGTFYDHEGKMIPAFWQTKADKMTLIRHDYTPPSKVRWPLRVSLSSGGYTRIKSYAYQSYVPSSQLSRDAGAGAGLNDND